MVFVFVFSETARSIIDLEIWLEVFTEFKSVVSTQRMILPGFTSLIVSFTWSYINCTFAESNGLTFTMHLWLIVFVKRTRFRFFTMLSPRMKTDFLFLLFLLLVATLLLLPLFRFDFYLGFVRLMLFLLFCLNLSLILSSSLSLLTLLLLLLLSFSLLEIEEELLLKLGPLFKSEILVRLLRLLL